jgi:hypothetical protein
MANTPDKGIKNVVIKKELLGKVTGSNATIVRFRLVAEDKNRKSAYSQIFVKESGEIFIGVGDINVVGNTVIVNWASGEVSTQILYDIFVGFDSSAPTFRATTGSTNYSFLKTGTTSVRVIVQASSINPTLNENLKIYDSGTVSLV